MQLCDFSFIYLFIFKIVNQKWGVRRDLLGSQVMCAAFQLMGQVGSSWTNFQAVLQILWEEVCGPCV